VAFTHVLRCASSDASRVSTIAIVLAQL